MSDEMNSPESTTYDSVRQSENPREIAQVLFAHNSPRQPQLGNAPKVAGTGKESNPAKPKTSVPPAGTDIAGLVNFLNGRTASAAPIEAIRSIVANIDEAHAGSRVPVSIRKMLSDEVPSGKSAWGTILVKAAKRTLTDEPYDPDARDGDNDGIVQDGTPWERPAGTRILDEFGEEIKRGLSGSLAPSFTRIVDSDGNDVDYTPKAKRDEADEEVPAEPSPKLQSLQDQGFLSVTQIVNAQQQGATQQQAGVPAVPEVPQPEPSRFAASELPEESLTDQQRSETLSKIKDLLFQPYEGENVGDEYYWQLRRAKTLLEHFTENDVPKGVELAGGLVETLERIGRNSTNADGEIDEDLMRAYAAQLGNLASAAPSDPIPEVPDSTVADSSSSQPTRFIGVGVSERRLEIAEDDDWDEYAESDKAEGFFNEVIAEQQNAEWRLLSFTDASGQTRELERKSDLRSDTKMTIARELSQRMLAEGISIEEIQSLALADNFPGSNVSHEYKLPNGNVVTLDANDVIIDLQDGTILLPRDLTDPATWQGLSGKDGSPPSLAIVSRDDPMYEELLAERMAGTMVQLWSASSNNEHAVSLAVQDTVEEMFGIEGASGWSVSPKLRDQIAALRDQHQDMFNAFVVAQYEYTQEQFEAKGITHLVLYRGMQLDASSFTGNEELFEKLQGLMEDDDSPYGELIGELVALRPISSFSYNRGTAENPHFTGGEGADSVVLSARVPVERIFSTAVTGNGCLEEQEVLVVGGDRNQFGVAYRLAASFDQDLADMKQLVENYQNAKNIPDWLKENYEFTYVPVGSETEESPGWAVALVNKATGKIHMIEAQRYGAPLEDEEMEWIDFEGLSKNPLIASAQEWEETFGHLDRDPATNAGFGLDRLQRILPLGWKVSPGVDDETGAPDYTKGASIDLPNGEKVWVSISDMFDETDLTSFDAREAADLIAKSEIDSLRWKLTDALDVDPMKFRWSEMRTTEDGEIVTELRGSLSTTNEVERLARIRSLVIPGMTPENPALPGLDGDLIAEVQVNGEWVKVAEVSQGEIFDNPSALSRFQETMMIRAKELTDGQ